MNAHALGILEYPRLLDVVAGFASSALGAARVRGLTPRADLSSLETEHRRVAARVTAAIPFVVLTRVRSMSLFDTLQNDLNAARKAQDKARVLVLGTIFSDAKNRKIELRRDLTDDEVVDVVRKGIKKRRESIEMYAGKRDDLADKERAEVAILEAYLPASVSDDELRAAVRSAIASGATQIGAVMGKVLPQFKGRAEGSTINAIAREELSKQG